MGETAGLIFIVTRLTVTGEGTHKEKYLLKGQRVGEVPALIAAKATLGESQGMRVMGRADYLALMAEIPGVVEVETLVYSKGDSVQHPEALSFSFWPNK